MANSGLYKLLQCIGILFALVVAQAPTAAQACAAGEEQDAAGECCVATLIVEEDGESKCKEVPSDMAVAVAVTLIGSFVFLISLQFFMNYPDPDMKENAYNIVSSTVSIFSAVLVFQSIDGLAENLIIEPYEKNMPEHCFGLLVDGIHMLLWYSLAQVVIAKVSGALLPDETREHLLFDPDDPQEGTTGIVLTAEGVEGSREICLSETKGLHVGSVISLGSENRTIKAIAPGVVTTRSPLQDTYEVGFPVTVDIKEGVKINCSCWGLVLAHTTGFASINFWTTIQQIEPFNQSPLLALVPIPMCMVGQLLLQRITDCCRQWWAAGDGQTDWFERRWDEQTADAENDIMGLSLSVIIVNACRYSINEYFGHRCLPNDEQKEEGEACEFERSLSQALWLLGVGLFFAFLLFVTKIIEGKLCPEVEEGEDEEEIGSQSSVSLKRTETFKNQEAARRASLHSGEFAVSDKPFQRQESEEKEMMEKFKARATETLIVTLSMSFSWCIFHSSRQLLMVADPGFLSREDNAGTLAVVLALIVTYVAFALIRILDLIADLPDEWTPPTVDEAIRQVIIAMSIFIGFAWEQTFDESVDALAERMRVYGGSHAPAFAKLFIGGGCVAVVFLAWKWYILPFVVREGWKFTYVYTKHDLLIASRALAIHDASHGQAHGRIEAHLKGLDAAELDAQFGGYSELAGSEDELSRLKEECTKLRRSNERLREANENANKRCDRMINKLIELNRLSPRIFQLVTPRTSRSNTPAKAVYGGTSVGDPFLANTVINWN